MALSAFLRELVLDDIPKASERANELGIERAAPARLRRVVHARARARSRRSLRERHRGVPRLLREARHRDGAQRHRPRADADRQHRAVSPEDPSSSGGRAPSGGGAPPPESKTETDRLALRAHAAARRPPGTRAAADGAGTPRATRRAPRRSRRRSFPEAARARRHRAAAAITVGIIVVLSRSRPEAGPAARDDATPPPALPYLPEGHGARARRRDHDRHQRGPERRAARAPGEDRCILHRRDRGDRLRLPRMRRKKGCPDGHGDATGPASAKEERATWSAFCNEPRNNRDDHPMNCVSFDDAAAFCRLSGKKLPTEDQWEYAARGTDDRAFPWGYEPPSPHARERLRRRLRARGAPPVRDHRAPARGRRSLRGDVADRRLPARA